MATAVDFMTISGGLLLSLACAALIEEVLLGGLFRLFFARRPEGSQAKTAKPGHNH